MPEAPLSALVNRTAADEVTVRAVRLDSPLTLDGRLDEPVYAAVAPLADFIQQEPREGAAATEKTEVWIFFDDTQPLRRRALLGQPARSRSGHRAAPRQQQHHPERELHGRVRHVPRSSQRLLLPDQPARRAARSDDHGRCSRTRAGTPSGTSRPRGSSRAGRWRWPSRSSRCATAAGGPQVWGINFRRIVKWKNEYSYLTPMPASLGTGRHRRMGLGRHARRPRDARRSR